MVSGKRCSERLAPPLLQGQPATRESRRFPPAIAMPALPARRLKRLWKTERFPPFVMARQPCKFFTEESVNTISSAVPSAVVTGYQLASGFERERKRLLEPQFTDRLSCPLAFWAKSNDRHLPLAFVGRPVRELLDTPFVELYSTPGVGPKKIASLLRLLERVSEESLPSGDESPASATSLERRAMNASAPNSTSTDVSEVVWSRWRQSVARHGLHDETLGHLARSLQQLPRTLWNVRLSSYLDLSLSEIRALRTHGAKRVAAVLAIFENLAGILEQVDANPHLSVRFRPRLVQRVESWVRLQCQSRKRPSSGEVQNEFIAPLLEQLSIDGGERHCDAARIRLQRPEAAVRALAMHNGTTRGRLYELWAEAATLVAVRWPEGQALTARLHDKLADDKADAATWRLFNAAVELWFPEAIPDCGRRAERSERSRCVAS